MPYRSREPIRRYELRSSRTMIVVTAMVIVLALVAVVFMAQLPLHSSRLPLLLVVGGVVVAAVAYAVSLRNEIVSGGRGAVVLYDRSMSVPRAVGATPLEFSYADLTLSVLRIESRTLGATVAVVSRLKLEGGGVTRSLSSRLFESPEAFAALVRDLEALRRGQSLPPEGTEQTRVRDEPDEMDDRLDEELAKLDA